MPIEPVTLSGKSVVLRPLARSDVPAMRALAAGPRASFEWAFVPTPDQVPQYMDGALALMERKAALVFAICIPDGELAGCTRLFDLQRWEWLPGKPRNTAYYTILDREWPDIERGLQAKLRGATP